MTVETGSISIRGAALDYAVFGKGERAFIILPGMSVKPVVPMAEQVAAIYANIEEEYRVYLFDRISEMPDGYTMWDMAEDCAAGMRALGIREADVFGASQGGMIALCLGLKYPLLVRKLVLGSAWSRPNETGRAVFEAWSRLGRAGEPVALNRHCFARIYSRERLEEVKDLLPALEKEGTAEELRKFAVMAEANLCFDVYDRLAELQCPVLALGAENDLVLDKLGTLEIAEKLGCESYIYPGASHDIYDEAADYRERILDFLRK